MMHIEKLEDQLAKELARWKGRASLFLEIEDRIIEFNSNEVFQSASLIKLPILFEALRQLEVGILQPDRLISVREEDKVGDTGVLQAMNTKQISVHDLLTLMIIVSDNSATNLVIDLLGMERINSTISTIGMKKTVLKRRMLDFKSIRDGNDNLTTSADIVLCLKEAAEGQWLTKPSSHRFNALLLQQQFKEKLPAYMNQSLLSIGNKTGELYGIEHDCAVITYGDRRAYAAVLIDGLEDNETGKSMIRQVGKLINSYISGIPTVKTTD
ncbi:serine hydrolase [Bacillus sp. ISL-35]|uniref:serine hydrolase n=1 Tax=Bacillus sp. ISL-35 TaxID=2819122 RepID=UPI001BE8D240|nr:serine hydrolase [Bacillus sp. ISL-35]MBT2680891.1 serine hydrolase [Bacillus sp. ISL-35]MBT2705207.1 serine hydrolase [Chryseobacterium sp. ISL-80]